jgi:hypothetical protein
MDDCPLDMAGIHVDAHGDATGIEVKITIENPSLVGELQRRAAHDVEHGKTLRNKPSTVGRK